MFEQYIGDGASLFITIVAILIGFATALSVIDITGIGKNKSEEE
jgi:hypothetical protein